MRIGELARRAGVNTSKIRFYEACDLLPCPARMANNYRDYDEHALRVVCFVHRARCLGFTLGEIADHLRSTDDLARKARLQARLETKLAELDAQIEEVRARRAVISGIIDEIGGVRAN